MRNSQKGKGFVLGTSQQKTLNIYGAIYIILWGDRLVIQLSPNHTEGHLTSLQRLFWRNDNFAGLLNKIFFILSSK